MPPSIRRRPLPLILAGLVLMGACAGLRPGRAEASEPFSFALVGDYNYRPAGGPEWEQSERLVESVNAARVRFVIHLGDIQSGRGECSDANVAATRAQFSRFSAPLVYLFGDNDWTDCHRYREKNSSSPFTDPLERLAHLRREFHSSSQAKGGGMLTVERQGKTARDAALRPFVENVRWLSGGIAFVGANVPGSNNNYSGGPGSLQKVKVPGQDEEWRTRNAAVVAWLRDSFRWAKRAKARGIVVAWHANPDLKGVRPDLPDYDSNGFNALNDTLRSETESFGGPVLLAHGDSHKGFRIDHPWPLRNFARVENFGHPNTHWTRVTVLPVGRTVEIFRAEAVRVPDNPGWPKSVESPDAGADRRGAQ